MKRLIALVLLVSILLSGCGSLLNKEYVSIEPYLDKNDAHSDSIPEVTSYVQLRDALLNVVENGVAEGTVIVAALEQENIDGYMQNAIEHIMLRSAVGAYTVEDITYEIGTSLGRAAVAVNITYNSRLSSLRKMRRVQNMEETISNLEKSLDKCEAGLVLLVEDYQYTDFSQLIQDYFIDNPDVVMELPQAVVTVYPESGKERIVDISFTYQTSRETLRQMQEAVDPVFMSARLYVSASANDVEKLIQLYGFLMERYEYTVETSITPTYSLLCHGVGDSKAFAAVYRAMCRQVGIECHMVSGTKNAQPWFWNVVVVDGVYCHLDLLQCSLENGFYLRSDGEMYGYVWDYSAYSG